MRSNVAWWAAIVGPLVAMVVASTTSAVRGEVGSANVGIALAIVVAVAALIGRFAGLTTATVAALSFNFFHTEPVRTLRINSAGDAAIVALLGLLGFVVGDISTWRRQHAADARLRKLSGDARAHADVLLGDRRPVGELWHGAVGACLGALVEADCRFVTGAPPPVPVVGRPSGNARASDTKVIIPHAGASVPVLCEAIVVGHLVVVPRRDVAPLSVDRRVLAALADHVSLVVNPLREVDGRWTNTGTRE